MQNSVLRYTMSGTGLACDAICTPHVRHWNSTSCPLHTPALCSAVRTEPSAMRFSPALSDVRNFHSTCCYICLPARCAFLARTRT